MTVTVHIKRFQRENSSGSGTSTYRVEAEKTDRVLDVLMDIKRNQDGTLGFRKSCAHGVCGSDAMIINGKERLACKTLVKDVVDGESSEIHVEPLKHLDAQRDLMVNQKPFFDKFRTVSPYLIPKKSKPEAGEYIQSREERAFFDDPTKCILCSSCYSACPILDHNVEFIGPAASIQAARFIKDSRDQGLEPRLGVVDQPNGVWACENHFECTRVCPREIKITKAINETKRLIEKHKQG